MDRIFIKAEKTKTVEAHWIGLNLKSKKENKNTIKACYNILSWNVLTYIKIKKDFKNYKFEISIEHGTLDVKFERPDILC